MRRCLVLVVAVLSAAALAGPLAQPVGARSTTTGPTTTAVDYRPPVDAPLVDGFRPPTSTFGPGNRGVDYATTEGQDVVAAASGKVVFAGAVGASLHAVILHADGLRSSYSFLASVGVRRGDGVEAGQSVGRTGGRAFHFGVRAGEAYLDPLVVLGQRAGRVLLVADPDHDAPLSEVEEGRSLRQTLAGVARGALALGEAAFDAVREQAGQFISGQLDLFMVLADDLMSLVVPLPVLLLVAAIEWRDEQAGCTPAEVAVPAPTGPRVAVLVGGLGSATGHAAVFTVDTTALGYGPDDVHEFSYRADGEPYEPADTAGDIGESARLLAARIIDLHGARPEAAIDVIAHSMGGLVARAALLRHSTAGVATLVTLGTPHQGADLATAGLGVDATGSGHAVLEGIGLFSAGAFDPNATAIQQMAETSPFIRDLPEDGWPPGAMAVSVAARYDLIVPSSRSRLAGAANVVVDVPGFDNHTDLPGSAAATREIGLALAGVGPTCRSFADAMWDLTISHEIAAVTDLAGTGLAGAGVYIDAKAKTALVGAIKR